MTDSKHTVATDALATLGTILDDTQARDAIHLAVEPVIAGGMLSPGDHVGIEHGRAFTLVEPLLGIVDPFLTRLVRPGERFWLVVYPRQITSLRHVWEHPGFPSPTIDAPQPAVATPVVAYKAPSKEESEKWLRQFVAGADCPGYEQVIAKALDNRDAWNEEYLHFQGQDAHGDIPPEFWDHVEIVTGKTIPPEKRATYFSCSC